MCTHAVVNGGHGVCEHTAFGVAVMFRSVFEKELGIQFPKQESRSLSSGAAADFAVAALRFVGVESVGSSAVVTAGFVVEDTCAGVEPVLTIGGGRGDGFQCCAEAGNGDSHD